HIRLMLLNARIAGKETLPDKAARLADNNAANHSAKHCTKKRGADRRRVALRRMTCGDMTDFMADHACKFRLIIGKRGKPARDIDIAARKRESVDDRAVENGDAIGRVRLIGVA